MEEYFDNLFKDVDKNIYLDEEQRKVILDDSKYLMVVAGAGSGKTTTMSAKVKYLVEIKKVNPKKIGMDNVGCEFCQFKDICFMKEEMIENLKEYKNMEFLGDDEDDTN